MLIDGIPGAIAFVIFLAPGALWAWMAERRQAAVPRSGVVEAGLVALASAAFSTPALVAVGLLVWGVDRDLSSLEAWIGSSSLSGEAAIGYTTLVLLELVLALLMTWFVFRRYGSRLLGHLELRRVSGWTSVLRDAKPDATWAASVDLLLEDGSVLRGIVEEYTPDHELVDREIVLAEPIVHELDGVSMFAKRPPPFRVVVPGTAIRRIAVHYLTPEDLVSLRGR